MVGKNLLPKEINTDWISTLLHSSSGYCDDHQDLRYNEKNVFCIDCTHSFCRHCREAHSYHRKVQIYKYVYQDVVRHTDLQKYFDCSKIQTYISNNERIIHLNPRSSSKDKPSKRSKYGDLSPQSQSNDTKALTRSKSGGTCEECGKHLQDERNRFCSIACKISVLSVVSQGQGLPISEVPVDQSAKLITTSKLEVSDLSLNDNQNSETESSISVAEPYEWVEVVNFRKRPRKATPQRPIFVLMS